MAFGFGFGLQFGSRGGGADPTALNEGRLTALGITTLRAGSAQRVNLPGGAISAYETVAANKPLWQPVTVAGRQYLALMVQDGSTPLVASSNNLSGWSTTGSPSVVYTASGGLGGGGYTLTARFTNLGELKNRAPVKIAGVKVGEVTDVSLDAERYDAVVTMRLTAAAGELPADSSAAIYTSGLLGERYIGITPGGDPEPLHAGDEIILTQSAVVLEQLIGKYLFGGDEDKSKP